MLRISKLTDYSIVVLTHMAGEPERVHNAAQLAEEVRIAAPTVSKILKSLSRVGLVISYRGAHGGYRLARDPRDIAVTEVISAMEGPLGLTECSSAEGLCAQESVCSLRGNWQLINEAVVSALRGITLEAMKQPADSSAAALQWHPPETVRPADQVR